MPYSEGVAVLGGPSWCWKNSARIRRKGVQPNVASVVGVAHPAAGWVGGIQKLRFSRLASWRPIVAVNPQ